MRFYYPFKIKCLFKFKNYVHFSFKIAHKSYKFNYCFLKNIKKAREISSECFYTLLLLYSLFVFKLKNKRLLLLLKNIFYTITFKKIKYLYEKMKLL